MIPKLFSPLTIKNLTLRNRIAVSPMCQYSSEDGFANNWHLVHLGARATGGAALIIQEASAVSPEGRITPYDFGIWKDDHVHKLKEITKFVSEQGAIPGIQLAHAGRKASITRPWEGNQMINLENGGWQTVAPSAIGYHSNGNQPIALDKEGISKVISDFQSAAKRALDAGYKIIELHAAHGYLLHQFLSPLTNKRTDEYGGSFENRCRLTIEILEKVKQVWPDELPIFVRISATDWASGGWNIVESVRFASILKDKGVDVIDVSSGGLVSHQEILAEPNYQVPFAHRIRQETGVLTAAVGLITTSDQAETILQQEKADLILFGRESLRNPNLPLQFANELDTEIEWPQQYLRAKYE